MPVAIVGAGPGGLGLLTVAGLRAIREAEVIIADRLGARSVLAQIAAEFGPLDAEVIDVGKLPGHHAVPQDEINRLLVEHGRTRRVVRLKGGDPYVFGRGSEERAHCVAHGVDVEVISGVTSAVAVPALAGIPLTHRGLATTFTVTTGHDLVPALSGGPDHTVVVLMGVGTLENTVETLSSAERPEHTPAAIVEDGFGDRERVTVGTLSTIAALATERGVKSPAVLIVGDVVGLSPDAPAALAARIAAQEFDPLNRKANAE